jgi:large subunit ribosomal protein L9
VIARKVGETDALYGSVTAADVAESLAAQQIDVDKRKIQLREPIKRLGEYAVPIKLHREVTATITLKVVAEDAARE